jgi:hypothetical protein
LTKARELPSIQVIHELMMNDLSALHIEDNQDKSALEYAILSEAPLPIVRMLQDAMVMKFKKRKDMDDDAADASQDVKERQAKRQKCKTRPKFARFVSTASRSSKDGTDEIKRLHSC